VRLAGLIGALLTNLSVVAAQPPRASAQATGPTFEIVSIKPNKSGGTIGGVRPQPGGRFVMVNSPIARLIRIAYPSMSPELIGAPAWVASERYDVEARAGAQPTAKEMESMLRAMLADRLKFVAHFESREQAVYALVVGRADERPAAGLRPATLDYVEFVERRPASGLNLPPRANGAPPCGLLSDGRKLTSGGITMAQLIQNISPFAGRVIIDKTALGGYYEFTLEYAAQPGNAAGVPDPADDRPSIFTALQEQLGLSLQSQRAPVEVLVIDRIERPTPN
jgi:uncharacterized protein (TIGR03435 family)